MTTTTNVKQTKLNIMTQSQYNSATKNATELYMITDAQISYNDLADKPTIPDTSNLANKDLSNLSATGEAKFQEPLVSGTNIKTINGNSILGSGDITIQSAPDIDEKSITTNTSDELQTVGVIDSNNTTNAIKTWTGTKSQYDAIVTKDANILYNITNDDTSIGDIVTDLNSKADVDLSNMNPTQNVKNTIVGWGMPDFSSRTTIPWDTSVQLPCDAVVYHRDYSDSWSNYCYTYISLDNVTWIEIAIWGFSAMASSYTVLPKGIYVKCNGGNDRNNYTAWYAPLKGAS